MSFQQQQHSNGVHYGRGSDAHGMHFYLTVQHRELQADDLMIPTNFVERYWKDVPNPISLILPNGSACKMNWVQRGDGIWLQNWKRFAWPLRCGDLLVFQYKGGSDFHVIILDDSKLEIDYSSMRCNDNQDSNKHCKQEEESDDDCVEILNDIATTSAAPQGTNIYKRKIDRNATKQIVSVDESSDAEATTEAQSSDESSDDEATEEDDDEGEESDEVSGESSYEDEMPKKAPRTRNGKRKMNMDFDATQQKFSASNKVAMVKKARKYQTSEAVNENPSFEVIMSQSYINGYFLWLPCEFSREHLIDFKGTATIRVGNERSVEVGLRYYDTKEKSCMGGGWKIFRQKYNLQVDDVCKFEMIRRRPFSFTVTITRALRNSNGPSPKKLPEGRDVTEHKTFNVFVMNKTPCVPKEFMKRGYHENIVELKMGRKSWFVKVSYYESLRGCRFSKGWRKFMKECKVEIGDTCLFKLIDESKFVFDVSIIGKNPLDV